MYVRVKYVGLSLKFKMCFEKGDMHVVITFESMTINVFKINGIKNLNL